MLTSPHKPYAPVYETLMADARLHVRLKTLIYLATGAYKKFYPGCWLFRETHHLVFVLMVGLLIVDTLLASLDTPGG